MAQFCTTYLPVEACELHFCTMMLYCSWQVLHVVSPHLHAHLLSCVLVEFKDSTGDCHMTQYDLDLWQTELSIEQKWRTTWTHVWWCTVHLTLDLGDDLDLNKMNICMRISRYSAVKEAISVTIASLHGKHHLWLLLNITRVIQYVLTMTP